MSFSRPSTWLLACSALSACTAIVATPDLPVCTENLDCEVANRLFAERTTECLQYQCINGGCALALPDLDADSEVSVECGGTDCDDLDPTRRMGAVELCDQVDNDCDFVVDEALPRDAPELGSVVLESPMDSQTNALTSTPGDALLLVRAVRELPRIARLSSSEATYEDFSIRSRELLAGDLTTRPRMHDGCMVRRLNPISTVENQELRRAACGDASDCMEFDAPCVAVRCEASECVYDIQHSFCEDDDPCNGQELCMPGSASADVNGCIEPDRAGCDVDDICDALRNTCLGLLDQPCSPVDIAVGAAGDSKALATIETEGCPSGLVRLGPDVGTEEHVLLQSAFTTGFVRGEVDVDSDGCTRDGASSLALAVSSTDAARCGSAQRTPLVAVVAYVATPFQEERVCDDSSGPSPVRVAGGHFVPVGDQPLVVPTDAGAVLDAGETGSSARPVLVALAERGRFLLIFADAAGGLRFSLLGMEDCTPVFADIAEADTHLSPLGSERFFTGGVTHIAAVALPDIPDSPTSASRFAFVYSVGCDTASRSFLATVEVRGTELEVGTPTAITPEDRGEDRGASHPTLQISGSPVLLQGHSSVTEDTHALLVAWKDAQAMRTEVHGRRFMLDASTPIDALPFVVSGADPNSIDPHVFVDGTGAAFVSYTRPVESGVVQRPFCGPSR